MATKFLDDNGLLYFWGKIKSYIANLLSSKADDSAVVHVAGTETVSGLKTFTNKLLISGDHNSSGSGLILTGGRQGFAIAIQTDRVIKGTAPSVTAYSDIEFYGTAMTKYQERLAVIENKVSTNNLNSIFLKAYNLTSAENTNACTISCNVDASGNAYTAAPTPAVADNSTKIATTAWVRTATGDTALNAATASAVAWSGVTDKPSTFTPSSHNQASNTITTMTSYTKASASSAIATSDSLNTAIGKLEYKIDILNANSVPPLEVVSLTANTSLTVTDSYTYQKVICLNTSGITVTLPTCSNSNARFFIKNNTNSKCYLALASGVTLDGSSGTIDLDPYGYINVIYGGSANTYIIIGGSI